MEVERISRGGAFLLLAVAPVSAMGGCPQTAREVRWPASSDYTVEEALEATAAEEGVETYLRPDGQRAEVPDDAVPTPGFETHASVVEGLYVAEVVVGEVEEGTPVPLVVMLHGRGDRPRVPSGPLGRVPTPMRVLVPRGPRKLGDGYAWARYSVTQNRDAAIAEDLVEVADRLVRVIDEARAREPVAGTTIATGFSQGAMLAWTLALRHPDRIGLALPLAGWVPPGARPDPLPTIQVRSAHGVADRIVRIEPTRALVSLLRDHGSDVELVEFPGVAHVVTREMNERYELWLEEALSARAPGLTGGLGERGIDEAPYPPSGPPERIDGDMAVEALLPE